MRFFSKIGLFILLPVLTNGQLSHVDSLRLTFNKTTVGSLKFKAASNIYFYYQELNRDSALFYTEQQLLIAKNNHNKIAEGIASVSKAYQLMGLGKYGDALKCLQTAFGIAEDMRNENEERWDYFLTPFKGNGRLLLLAYCHHIYALLMQDTGNLEQQIYHFRIAGKIGKEINYAPRIQLAYLNLGQSYLAANKPDSALYYEKQAERTALETNDSTFRLARAYLGTVQMHMGDIYKALGDEPLSKAYYYRSLQTSIQNNNFTALSRVALRLSRYYIRKANKDSSLYFSLKALEILKSLGKVAGIDMNIGSGYENVYLSYKLNNRFDSAFKYQGLALLAKDSLSKERISNLAEFQKLTYSEQLRLQNLEKEKVVYQNRVRTYFMLSGIAVLLLLAIIFYRNNRQKHKAKVKIEKAYDDLKATQQQLIQSEKMASLGELTAGIAHEIQNPLNFVNNFSELNNELIEELKIQKSKVKSENPEEDELLNDIFQNNEKINLHGKRADAIVKGMLQHSQSGTGKKAPTDINVLADEYLRLAYHGMKGKDSSFNIIMKTDFDESIGNINIVPQDIGKVLLNLFNNAFYAVNEKKKLTGNSYEPTISIRTRLILPPPGGLRGAKITVSDNGGGIDAALISKIFQPFFTTKPTGQGTGLGLSLAYDIVKAHGGELKVETTENEGTEFSIVLPATHSS